MLSYFLDGATGGVIVVLQTLLFLAAFVFAPKHGLLAARRSAAEALRSRGAGAMSEAARDRGAPAAVPVPVHAERV